MEFGLIFGPHENPHLSFKALLRLESIGIMYLRYLRIGWTNDITNVSRRKKQHH